MVDVAVTLPLVRESAASAKEVLIATNWDIRCLSKSPLIKDIARRTPSDCKPCAIRWLSTGTFDAQVDNAIEPGAPHPNKRLAALKDLQQSGHPTFPMIYPILQQGMTFFAQLACQLVDFADANGSGPRF